MKKRFIIGIIFIFTLLISPFISTSSAFITPLHKTNTMNPLTSGLSSYMFLCHVNSTGYAKAVHDGNGIFIALEYDEDSENINTTLKTFVRSQTITRPHKIQVFFLIGDYNLPYSGTKGNCTINGMVLMAFVW